MLDNQIFVQNIEYEEFMGILETQKFASTQEAQQSGSHEATVLQTVIGALNSLPPDARQRMVDTVCVFLGLTNPRPKIDHQPVQPAVSQISTSPSAFRFSESETPNPKQFLLQKNPTTDIERVACLAYYLTHYRSLPHFKTKDISDLNTEAAQRRFSNAAFSVANAATAGYLVPSVKGCKQIGALGEQFVQALPDREAAREAMERLKRRKVSKRLKGKAADGAEE